MCKNHKYSYARITNLNRAKSRASFHSQLLQREQNTQEYNKGCKGAVQGELQTSAQRKKRAHKQMEKHSMLMVRNNQYGENGHTSQSNL